MTQYNTQTINQESGEQTEENATFELSGGADIELNIPKLEDVDHPLVPEVGNDYLMREINGISDLELISHVIDDPDYFAMLEGEAGVGKDMAVKTIGSAANWPMLRVNFGLGTSYSNLVGRYAPVDSSNTDKDTIERSEAVKKAGTRIFEQSDNMTMDKAIELASHSIPQGSSFQWVDGLLTRAVRNGYLFLADEINTAEAEAISALNGLTEEKENRYLTIEEKSEVIEPHENFRFVATRNPVSYTGTSQMNSALESRAYVISVEYHESQAIEEIIKDNSNIIENESEEALSSLVDLAQDIRRQEQSGNSIITKISSRSLIKVARLTDVMGIRNATKTVFLGIADPTDEQSISEMIETQKFD
jgi:nitric oxide reductase NorQ protein/cobaltochelatase CobS